MYKFILSECESYKKLNCIWLKLNRIVQRQLMYKSVMSNINHAQFELVKIAKMVLLQELGKMVLAMKIIIF